MDNIVKITLEILITLILIAVTIILPKVKHFIDLKITDIESGNIYSLIGILVEAAEQTLKKDDPTGQLRKEYVMQKLMELEIEITADIDGYIESAVYNLNNEQTVDAK